MIFTVNQCVKSINSKLSLYPKERKILIERFSGADGVRRLVMALCTQPIIQGDEVLAKKIASLVELLEFDTQYQIIRQDDYDNDIYFILSGQTVIKVNGRDVAYRNSGSHVGEMSLIDPSSKRCASVITTEKTVVARMSEANFSVLADSFPKLWRYLAIELSGRLRERNHLVSLTNQKPILFIGSSSESLKVARAVQLGLDRDDLTVKVWTDDIFTPSLSTMESLEEQLKSSDFAALVLGFDDTVISREKTSDAPRDNVLLELGMFIGALGRQRTYIIRPRGVNLKIPSDLFGITPIEYTPGNNDDLPHLIAPVCESIRRVTSKLGSK
jgi:CRP/FNR family transcriptional regulator, cyclic AMP receptor protein